MLITQEQETALHKPPPRPWDSVSPADWRPEVVVAPGRDAYRRSIGALFGVDASRTAATTTLRTAELGVTRLSSSVRGAGMSSPLPVERAYGMFLQLQDAVGNELWKNGRRAPAGPFLAGTLVIAKLEDEPTFNLREAFDSLFIHVPAIAFDELAADHGAAAITDFSDEAATPDPVVRHLGCALLPYLDNPRQGERLFFDHIVFAIHARLASRYGRLAPPAVRRVGGLTPRQERAAKAALIADLGEEPSLAEVATACGLPPGRFARAFRQTTGVPPYRWLRTFRVERAKDLLLGSPSTLAQIAYECGFADQSHFTRVFTAAVGTTPGAWRRGRRG
jgi:AraC-like DNA-binding protein